MLSQAVDRERGEGDGGGLSPCAAKEEQCGPSEAWC